MLMTDGYTLRTWRYRNCPTRTGKCFGSDLFRDSLPGSTWAETGTECTGEVVISLVKLVLQDGNAQISKAKSGLQVSASLLKSIAF